MSREIKFRAWHSGNQNNHGKLVHSPAMLYDENAGDCLVWKNQGQNIESVMQYTGLKDKNGVEIYEGDIVTFYYFYGSVGEGMGFVECDAEIKGVVKWGNLGWAISSIAGEHWSGYTGYKDGEGSSYMVDLSEFGDIEEDSFEVIGNISENPELLEVES